jgi:hypothetical protein
MRITSVSIGRMILFAAATSALAACKSKPDRATVCAQLRDQSVAIAQGLSRGLGGEPGDEAEIREMAAKIQKECMTWPDEVFACMQPGADPESKKCRDALAAAEGVVPADDDAPAGPAVSALGQLGEAPYDGHAITLAADGGVIAVERDAVVALDRAGTIRWRTPIDHADWSVTLDDGTVVVADADADAVVALDPATGQERWREPIPPGADEYDTYDAKGAVRVGAHVAVALEDGRFLRLDPARCGKPAVKARKPVPACLTPMFTAPDKDELYDPKLAANGDDVILGGHASLRWLSPDGKPRGELEVRDMLGGFAVMPGGRLAVTLDDELVILDLAACAGPAFALPRKRGRMYIEGEGDCERCIAPPTGCVIARPEVDDVDFNPPLVLRDGSVVVTTSDGIAKVSPNGEEQWTSTAAGIGTPREVGGALLAVSSGVGDDLAEAPLQVTALDPATGKVTWRTALAARAGFIVSSTDVVLAANPPWVVAGYKGALSWIKLP